jgi:uncharacterized protein (DUF433 family)
MAVDWSQCLLVESDVEKVHGAWVFKNTRLPISIVFENIARGASIGDIVEWYRGVTPEQISAVINYVAISLDTEAETTYAHANSVRS